MMDPKFEASVKENDDLEQEVKGVLVVVEDLELRLQNSQEMNKVLQEELKALKHNLEESSALAEARATTIAKLQQEKDTISTDSEKLLADLTTSDTERAEAAREIQRLMQELDDWKKIKLGCDDMIKGLQVSLEDSRKQSESNELKLKSAIDEQRHRAMQLENTLNQRDRELLEARAAIEDLRLKNEQLNGQVATQHQILENFKKTQSAVREMIRSRGTNAKAGS